MRLTEKDIKLLTFLKKFKVLYVKEAKGIYGKGDYSYKRLKQLETEKYIRKIDWYKVKIDVNGTKLLREIGYDYNYVCRRKDYQSRVEEISKIAGMTLGSSIEFTASWELKDKMVFTDKGRKYIGELKYKNKKYLVYYISKRNKQSYIGQIINDINKAVDYQNIIVFSEEFSKINRRNKFFMLGKHVILIINPTNENLDRMRLFQEKDIYEIIEKIYKGKDILLSNWEKAEPILKENNTQTEIEKLNIQEHDLKEKLKKLLDLKLDNLITEEAFKEKNYEIERKIKNIQKVKEDKEGNIEKEDSLKGKIEGIKELLKKNQIITEFDREVFNILVDKVIIGGIDENGNKNPYIINFVLKNNKINNDDEISKNEEKRAKKQDINYIDIKDKNILCEVKSFQRLKIFEKDEDLFRSKKQLEYIIVRIVTNYDNYISLDIAV